MNINYSIYGGGVKHLFLNLFQSFENCSTCDFHLHENSFDFFGRSVTMPYKISFTNFANLSYVGEYFHEKISRRGREFCMEGELDFLTLMRNDQQSS